MNGESVGNILLGSTLSVVRSLGMRAHECFLFGSVLTVVTSALRGTQG